MIEQLSQIQAHATGMDQSLIREELEFCAESGTLRIDEGGFIAYFRCRHCDLPIVKRGDIKALRRLPKNVLRGGPVIFVADILAVEHGYVWHTLRGLCRLPGVERLVGYTKNHWFDRRC